MLKRMTFVKKRVSGHIHIMNNFTKSSKIYIAGHNGLVGSAISRALKEKGFTNIIVKTRSELNLTDNSQVMDFFESEKPEFVFDCAAKVGGILANDSYPAEFIHENLLIQNNLIDCSYKSGVKKFLFLGSSCIYPKLAKQPIKEEYLLTGELEPTNEWYAVAKIAGIKMCQAYKKQYGFNAISIMPTNLYGPNDNFDLESSHVLPALIRKFHEAKISGSENVIMWGTGSPKREFLHVDDMAGASIFLMGNYSDPEIINVGTGEDVTIKELGELVKEITGFKGEIKYDTSKPDGTPRKLLNVDKINSVGWKAETSLKQGVSDTYKWFLKNY